jgi:hypothetical protein
MRGIAGQGFSIEAPVGVRHSANGVSISIVGEFRGELRLSYDLWLVRWDLKLWTGRLQEVIIDGVVRRSPTTHR